MRFASVALAILVALTTESKAEVECDTTMWNEVAVNVTDMDADSGFIDAGWSTTADASQDAVDFFQGLRGGDDDFYAEALEAIMAVYCLDASTLGDQRYVEKDDSMAAKNENDQCIEAKDFDPQPAEYCEVVETCYWAPVKTGMDREKKIEDEQLQRDNFDQYYEDLGFQYLVTPVVIGTLNFLATLIFFILRCCCGKCAGKDGEGATTSEYTKAEKMVPIFFFVLFSLAILILSASAYVGNEEITDGLLDTTQSATTGLENLENFMVTSKDILEDIQVLVEDAVEEAEVTLDGTDWVAVEANTISELLQIFSAKYAGNELLADLDLQPVLDNAVQQSQNSIGPVVEDIGDTIDIVQIDLIGVKDDIVAQTGDAIDSVDTLVDSIVDMKEQVEDVEEKLESTDLFRKGGVLALFGLTIILIILAYIGIIAGLTPCKGDDWTIHFMNLTWIFGSLIATLAFIVGGASLTISVFWSDMCHFSDLIVDNFGEYLDEQTATGMNACFNNTGLVQAYNLTDELDFAGQIDSQLNVLEALDIPESMSPAYESIEEVGNSINRDLDLVQLFAELNSLTTTGVSTNDENFICADYSVPQDHNFEYTEENVREPWVVHEAGQTATWSGESFARQGMETGLQYIQRLYTSNCNADATVPVPFDEAIETAWLIAADTVQIKEDMFRDLGVDAGLCAALGCPTDDFSDSSIKGFLSGYESKLIDLQISMIEWTDSTVGDAIYLVESFQCNAKCYFIKLAYDSMHESLCTTTLGGFQTVSLALLFLGLCNIPVVITSAIMVVRLRGLWMGEASGKNNAQIYAVDH